MEYNCTVNIRGRDFKFEILDDEPLRYIMTIDDKNYLIRDIDCDVPYEKWTLVNKYKSISNGVEKDETFSSQVYHGKDIEDENFMKQLLENVLFEFLIGDEDIRLVQNIKIDKEFNDWLEQFIKESGHAWGMGFYFELKNGEVLYNGTDEYKSWYDSKLEEYSKK